jgi:hypothetical protein
LALIWLGRAVLAIFGADLVILGGVLNIRLRLTPTPLILDFLDRTLFSTFSRRSPFRRVAALRLAQVRLAFPISTGCTGVLRVTREGL